MTFTESATATLGEKLLAEKRRKGGANKKSKRKTPKIANIGAIIDAKTAPTPIGALSLSASGGLGLPPNDPIKRGPTPPPPIVHQSATTPPPTRSFDSAGASFLQYSKIFFVLNDCQGLLRALSNLPAQLPLPSVPQPLPPRLPRPPPHRHNNNNNNNRPLPRPRGFSKR